MTVVKNLKPSRRSGAALDLAIPSTPANSFITDISMWFLREPGNWLPAATWVLLLGTLGIPAPTARTALHRMTKAGYLQRVARNGSAGYSMSPRWLEFMDEAGDELSGPNEAQGGDVSTISESDDSWTLLTFSIPEARRAERHAIRTLLGRHGFGSLGNGVWIASAARLPRARAELDAGGFAGYVDIFEAKYEGFANLSEFVRRCWDIDAIAAMYRDFSRDVRLRLKRDPAADARTFADIILTSNAWRRINFNDPALPTAALPDDWPRVAARRRQDELFTRFLDPARVYVESLRSDRTGDGARSRERRLGRR